MLNLGPLSFNNVQGNGIGNRRVQQDTGLQSLLGLAGNSQGNTEPFSLPGGFPGRTQGQPFMLMMLFSILSHVLQMLSQLGGGYQPPQPPPPPVYPPVEPPVYPPPPVEPPPVEPPVYPPPPVEPPPVEPPVYPPPPEKPKALGSAGLFGDPQFQVFTPNLTLPDALKSPFASGIGNGQTVTLINDPDKGGLKVDVTGIQVDPRNAKSTGVGEAVIKAGTDTVVFKNNGDLVINGVKKGNIKDGGFIAPITLANGSVVSTSNEIDGAGGVRAERFVISNGEYKITAALRSPHPDSKNFLDMNFEELVNNAADNASGYQTSVPGLTGKFGIVDLLKLEPQTA